MGMHLTYIKPDEVFINSDCEKIILNDMDNRTTSDKAYVNSQLMLEVSETYDSIPSCNCGALNKRIYEGVVCSSCNSVVETQISTELKDSLWVKSPKGVPALMNPKFWHQMNSVLSFSNRKFSMLQWLTDPSYRPLTKNDTKNIITSKEKLKQAGLAIRSYENFYNRFDEYVDFLFDLPEFNSSSKKWAPLLYALIKEHRDKVWTQYIQIPNKAITVIENTNNRRWITSATPMLLRAIRPLIGIDNLNNKRHRVSNKTKQSTAVRMMTDLGLYYNSEMYTNFYGKKPGDIRKQQIATRSHFTARNVVTAFSGQHDYDEVHIGWGTAMNLLQPHIKSILYNQYRFTSKQINKIMTKYKLQYHPLLHKVMLNLIKDSVNPWTTKIGIPVMLNRNPTLGNGSNVLLRITYVKTDVRDYSTTTSGRIVACYNGDFDGDEENFLLMLDWETVRNMMTYEVHNNVTTLTSPYGVSNVMNIPKGTTLQIMSLLRLGDSAVTANDQSRMQKWCA